ncbi:hypothetical protein DID75_05130 [Candidatus Marinamargulisbacteria bacterium SCGC AG-410-N11]|nr:hypothetical protein DID75_05130 [Candidatus Marinamargulisbacteria bacterium SCGC AG-410-N11]
MLIRRSIFNLLVYLIKDVASLGISFQAAALSFYTLISIIPFLVVVTTLLTFFDVELAFIFKFFSFFLPTVSLESNIIKNLITFITKDRSLFGISGLVISYFISSRLVYVFFRSLRAMFSYSGLITINIFIIILAIPIFLLILLISYITFSLLNYIFIFPNLVEKFGLYLGWGNISHSLLFLGYTISLFLIYFFGVNRKYRRFSITLSISIVMSVLFGMFHLFFTFFIVKVAVSNPVYGAFGGFFGLMLWIYINYIFLLFGARVIYLLEKKDNFEIY